MLRVDRIRLKIDFFKAILERAEMGFRGFSGGIDDWMEIEFRDFLNENKYRLYLKSGVVSFQMNKAIYYTYKRLPLRAV